MKKIFLVWSLLSFFIFVAGCQDGRSSEKVALNNDKKAFPEFLVGTWASDDSRWIFTFEPNGSISRMRHFVGMIFEVEEGGLTEEGRDGIEATYVLGPCETDYDAETDQLTVNIAIDYYTIKFKDGNMEGHFDDTLTGPVSKDEKKWIVSWKSFGEIFEGNRIDKDNVVPRELSFTKSADDFQY